MLFVLILAAMLTGEESRPGDLDARTRYSSYFTGRYAVDGACAEPQAMWILGEKEISQGSMTCVIHEVTEKTGALSVRLGLCTEDGEARRARRLTLDMISDDALRASGRFGRVLLRRCP